MCAIGYSKGGLIVFAEMASTPATSTAAFTLTYEGPALQDGRMAVRDLIEAAEMTVSDGVTP